MNLTKHINTKEDLPFLTVIIPCYNSEAFVKRAVESVLRQTYSNYEILLVDNASTDDTLSILYGYAEAYPHLVRVLEEPRKGAPYARNKGLREAKGEWLQFLDADDELLPEKLQHQVELAQTTSADLIAGSIYEYQKEKKGQNIRTIQVISTNPWKALIKTRLGKTSSILWRKAAMEAVGGWNESMTSSQEYELMFRLLQNNYTFQFQIQPETIYNKLENSISRTGNNQRLVEILNNYVNLRLNIRDYLQTNGLLTRELKTDVATTIYNVLQSYRKQLPQYANVKLKEAKFSVPFQFLLRLYFTRTKLVSFYHRRIRT